MTKRSYDDKTFAKRVAELNKKAVTQQKVVNLNDYRQANRKLDLKTILIVDDELVIRNAIKRIFEGENYRVLMAKDALELSKTIQDINLDLILLDVNLPWVNGYDLCMLIKSNPSLKDIPVVFISGNKTDEDIKRGFEAGCDDYVTKPFEINYLQEVVNKTLLKEPMAPAV